MLIARLDRKYSVKKQMENTILKIIKGGIFLVFLTPLIIGPFGLTLSAYPKAVYFSSLVEIILIFYIALILLNKKYIPKIHLPVMGIIIFIAVSLFASLLGFNFTRGFLGDPERAEGIILYIHLLIFLIIIMGIFEKKESWLRALKFFAFVGGLSSLTAITQKLGIFKFYGIALPDRMSGTLSNPDFFGQFVVLLIFLTAFIFLAERAKDLKVVWGTIIFIDILALYYTRTRGAWLGFVIGMIFVAGCWFFSRSRRSRLEAKTIKRLAVAGAFTFVLVVSFVLFPNFSPFKNFSNLLQTSLENSINSRLNVWSIAFNGWKQKPILGWGVESFSYVYDKDYRGQFLNFIPERIYFDRPHNKILEIMNDTGVVGLSAYFFIFLASIFILFKNRYYWRQTSPPNKDIFIFLLVGFLIAYFIQNIFYFDTISSYISLYLILGFINNIFLKPQEKNIYSFEKLNNRFSRKKIFTINLFAIMLLGIFYKVNLEPTLAAARFPYYAKYEKKDIGRAYEGYAKVMKTKTIYDKDFRLVFIERSIYILENGLAKKIQNEVVANLSRLRPLLEKDAEVPDRRPSSSYEYLARISQWEYFATRDDKYLADMESALKKGIEFNDETPVFYQLMGELRIIQDMYSEAEDYFAKMYGLTPKRPQDTAVMYRKIGIAYLKANDPQKAVENFKKALDIDYDYKKSTNYSALDNVLSFIDSVAVMYYRDLGDFDSAEKLYEREIEVYPNNRETFLAHLEILRQDYEKKK